MAAPSDPLSPGWEGALVHAGLGNSSLFYLCGLSLAPALLSSDLFSQLLGLRILLLLVGLLFVVLVARLSALGLLDLFRLLVLAPLASVASLALVLRLLRVDRADLLVLHLHAVLVCLLRGAVVGLFCKLRLVVFLGCSPLWGRCSCALDSVAARRGVGVLREVVEAYVDHQVPPVADHRGFRQYGKARSILCEEPVRPVGGGGGCVLS